MGIEDQFRKEAQKLKRPADRLGPVGLMTLANKINASRMIITNHNAGHAMNLVKPDFPLVYTGRENALADYSSMIKKSDHNQEVIGIFRKNKYYYHLLTYDKEKKLYDVIARHHLEEHSEGFTTKYNNEYIDNLKIGDKIKDGDIYATSNSFDSNGNYRLGKNLNQMYAINVNTQEDGIILMNDADKLMAGYRCKTYQVYLSDMDVFLALYRMGDSKGDYSAFPRVGQKIKNGILVGTRKIDHSNAPYALKDKYLKRIIGGDQVIYANGKVIDITINTNLNLKDLKDVSTHEQFNEIYKAQLDYYTEIYRTLKDITDGAEEGGYTYSRRLTKLYAEAYDRVDAGAFIGDHTENVYKRTVIEFKVMYKQNMVPGDKMAGRCGSKGVISNVFGKHESYFTEDGRPIHVILDALSIVSRLNPMQFDEQALNDMSRTVISRMIEEDGHVDKQLKILMGFIKDVNPDDHKELRGFLSELNEEQKQNFVKKVIKNGINIQLDPIENLKIEDFERLYDKYPTTDTRVRFPDGSTSLYKVIVAPMYFWRLKQLSGDKYSVRGRGTINPITHLPSKSADKARGTDRFSNVAVKLGIYEIEVLLLCKRPEAIAAFMAVHCTSSEARDTLSELYNHQVTPDNIQDIMSRVTDRKKNREIIEAYLHTLSIKMVIEYEENPDYKRFILENKGKYKRSYRKRINKVWDSYEVPEFDDYDEVGA